ncbi:hypothetical protein [Geoalkalibacter sp.]|uniref:hypothetical protein n=1 Tax=Geoalkalibacter sp. TaxID=3041440 RepID=UPI00272E4305|nr:hypothetical protein [Geoalkalibacter sp.]
MLTLLLLWPFSALATLLIFAAVSLWFDGRLASGEWIRLWLLAMMLLGPLGTLLTARFMASVAGEVRRESARAGSRRDSCSNQPLSAAQRQCS